jgi:hypothetical protein
MTRQGEQIHRRAQYKAPPSRSAWRHRLCRWFGVLGLAVASVLPVAAQPAAIPQHWISYAQLTSNQFQDWLSDPTSAAVVRLHAALAEGLSKTLALDVVARVWVAADGRVERLEFPSLGNAQADADLRTVLMSQLLPESPPPDMRQPMVLQLSLSPEAGKP